jgi:hypothetical protein
MMVGKKVKVMVMVMDGEGELARRQGYVLGGVWWIRAVLRLKRISGSSAEGGPFSKMKGILASCANVWVWCVVFARGVSSTCKEFVTQKDISAV